MNLRGLVNLGLILEWVPVFFRSKQYLLFSTMVRTQNTVVTELENHNSHFFFF